MSCFDRLETIELMRTFRASSFGLNRFWTIMRCVLPHKLIYQQLSTAARNFSLWPARNRRIDVEEKFSQKRSYDWIFMVCARESTAQAFFQKSARTYITPKSAATYLTNSNKHILWNTNYFRRLSPLVTTGGAAPIRRSKRLNPPQLTPREERYQRRVEALDKAHQSTISLVRKPVVRCAYGRCWGVKRPVFRSSSKYNNLYDNSTVNLTCQHLTASCNS